jgi:hypothetical protein
VTKLGFLNETLADSYISSSFWFRYPLSQPKLWSFPIPLYFSLTSACHTAYLYKGNEWNKSHFVSTYFLIDLVLQFKVIVFRSSVSSWYVFWKQESEWGPGMRSVVFTVVLSLSTRSRVEILAGRLALLTEDFRGLTRPLQAYVWVVFRIIMWHVNALPGNGSINISRKRIQQ